MNRRLIWDAIDMIDAGELDKNEFEKLAQALGEKPTTKEDLSRQFDKDFGVVIILENGDKLRKFPLNSKANTVASMQAFMKNREKMPDEVRGIVATRIIMACERYNIPDVPQEVKQLMVNSTATSNYYPMYGDMLEVMDDSDGTGEGTEVMSSTAAGEKTSSSRTLWGINDIVNGEPLKKYAMKTSSQVINLINDFPRIAPKMLSKYAFQLADNIIKRAAELKVHIPDNSTVLTYANGVLSPFFKNHMEARIKCAAVKNMTAVKEYLGLLKKASGISPRQVAVELEGIDFTHNMHHRYGVDFGNPTTSVLMLKRAEELDAGDVQIDTVKLVEAIKDHRALFEDYLDKEIVDNLESNPDDTLKTMAIPLRQLIARLLGSVS